MSKKAASNLVTPPRHVSAFFIITNISQGCTKGIWMWGMDTGEDIVLALDTEGLSDTQNDAEFDSKLYSLVLMLSSYVVINVTAVLDENLLNHLRYFKNLRWWLRIQNICFDTRNSQFRHPPIENHIWKGNRWRRGRRNLLQGNFSASNVLDPRFSIEHSWWKNSRRLSIWYIEEHFWSKKTAQGEKWNSRRDYSIFSCARNNDNSSSGNLKYII